MHRVVAVGQLYHNAQPSIVRQYLTIPDNYRRFATIHCCQMEQNDSDCILAQDIEEGQIRNQCALCAMHIPQSC